MKNQAHLLPLAYFAPIAHYSLISTSQCLFEINETYQKRSVRNRCKILGPNGVQNLSIPLAKGKNQLPISEVKISYEEDWQKVHFRSLRTAYNTSPYFDFYEAAFEQFYKQKFIKLMDLNMASFELISSKTSITAPKMTKEFIKETDSEIFDLRPKKHKLCIETAPYTQVFAHKFGFVGNLSILDLLFNRGPELFTILKDTRITFNQSTV